MPRVIAAIVRHADYRQLPGAPSAHQPFPLTPEGEGQARQGGRALGEALQRAGWVLSPAVDSSQLLRAWQTARIFIDELVDRFPSPPQLRSYDALAERGVGSAANLTTAQIEQIVHEDPRFPDLPADWKSDSHFRLPLQGAESLMDSGQRVAAHLERQMAALAEHVDQDTVKLFVGHGAAFRHAAHKLGVFGFEQIARLSMWHAQPVFLERRADAGWVHIGGEWKLRGRRDGYTD